MSTRDQRTTVEDEGWDVVGDVHGHAGELARLLGVLGYEERDGAWRHPTRRAAFVGDLVDRGPEQVRTVAMVRAMQAAGSARVVAGNHELNAIAWATPHPDRPGEHLRPHTADKLVQHEPFLDDVGEGSALHAELLAWFGTLPLWLELDGGLRVVHACWDPWALDWVAQRHGPVLTPDLVLDASTEPDDPDRHDPQRCPSTWLAVEHLCKGPEIDVPVPYLDKQGAVRHRARLAWWDPDADRLDRAVVVPGDARTPGGDPYPNLPAVPVEPVVAPYRADVPVAFGHYWRSPGERTLTGPRAVCVDFSAGRGAPLVAYRWSGETDLVESHLVASR